MGLYYRPTILPSDPDGLDHYFAHSEIALPMQLYLYDYESGKNIFSWRPIEDQWWITGFNPEYKDEKADAKNQVMISHAVIDIATVVQIVLTSAIPGFYDLMCSM